MVAEYMLLDSLSNKNDSQHANLSNRELEIFQLLVDGYRISEIANKLAISDKTVSSHKKNLMQKMHFSSMADLMRYAVQRRLFDETGPDERQAGDEEISFGSSLTGETCARI